MPRLKRLLVNASFEIAQRQRRCSRNNGHIIPHGQKCLVIKENMMKRNYCLECAATIIEKAQKELTALTSEMGGAEGVPQES